MPAPRYPAIPDPTTDPQSLRDTVLALKQAVELLSGQRGDVAAAGADALATTNNTVSSQGTDIATLQGQVTTLQGQTLVSTIDGVGGAFTTDNTSGIQSSSHVLSLRQGSASQFGAVKVDNTTLQASGGVISTLNPALSRASATLGANVATNNTANYFTGPSVNLGTTGTWLVIGKVTLTNSVQSDNVIKLWDGTTIIDSAVAFVVGAVGITITLAGIITNPAGNLRVSVRDRSTTSGQIAFNSSGNSMDSTIIGIRLA